MMVSSNTGRMARFHYFIVTKGMAPSNLAPVLVLIMALNSDPARGELAFVPAGLVD